MLLSLVNLFDYCHCHCLACLILQIIVVVFGGFELSTPLEVPANQIAIVFRGHSVSARVLWMAATAQQQINAAGSFYFFVLRKDDDDNTVQSDLLNLHAALGSLSTMYISRSNISHHFPHALIDTDQLGCGIHCDGGRSWVSITHIKFSFYFFNTCIFWYATHG